MDANDNQILRECHRQLQQLNQQMESLLQHIAMEDSTCDTYRDLGRALLIIAASIDMTLTHCIELARVPEISKTIEFVVHRPTSGQVKPQVNSKQPDSEQLDSEQPDSEQPDAEIMEVPSLEDLTALLSLIQRTSEIALARCHYFDRTPSRFFSSLNKASASIVRERRYVSKLRPVTTNVRWVVEDGPNLEIPVDPDKWRIRGSEHGRTPEDRG